MSPQTRTAVRIALGAGAAFAVARAAMRPPSYSFTGRIVLITGGSRGLGLVIARQLVREGARVAICARDAAELERARIDLENQPVEVGRPRVVTVECDVSDREAIRRMVYRVREELGSIDVLINNAGVIQVGPMEVMTIEDYEQAMGVHFWGPLYSTLAVLLEMRQRGGGRIVNISSIGGKIAVPHLLPYCASKFALVGFSEGLRAETAKDGIVVTTVCPGLMRTGSPLNAMFKGRNDQEYAWFSVSDSLPVTSMSAERAARQVIEACRRGDAEVVLSIPAKAAAGFQALFPGSTARIMAFANQALPRAGGIGTDSRKGSESQSAKVPAWLTKLSREAARRNNESAPQPVR